MKLLLWFVARAIFIVVGTSTMISAGVVLVQLSLGLNKHIDPYIVKWARLLLFLGRAKMTVTGAENIPDGPCIFVFNHMSIMDIPALFAGLPRTIRFGAKKELFYIPLFGLALNRLGILKIDRGDRPKAIEALKNAAVTIKKGQAYIFAAEGTRQDENTIGEFKSGPFILAIEAQVPLVPVVLVGAREVLSKNELFFHLEKDHPVQIEILKPIFMESYSFENRAELKSLTRNLMVNSFENLKRSRLNR